MDSEAERNADPCTSRGCMWGKFTDGKVYIPYYITNHSPKYTLSINGRFFTGMEHNFRKIATLNQGTSYDYNSVMQYHKYAFSKNNQPTIVPIPNSTVNFGNAHVLIERSEKIVSSSSLHNRSCRPELTSTTLNHHTINLL
eukprot:superscaffoldBa00002169_g13422